jgi:hypothetical protein
LDVLVSGGAAFEFKATEALVDRHRSQLLNYLLLTGLARGKLVNVRSEQVQHEFVNSVLNRADRTQFRVDHTLWNMRDNDALLEWVVALLRDLGTRLDVSLYEDAITQFLGGSEAVEKQVSIFTGDYCLGSQPFRLVRPGSALKVTAINDDLAGFEATHDGYCSTLASNPSNGSTSPDTVSHSVRCTDLTRFFRPIFPSPIFLLLLRR